MTTFREELADGIPKCECGCTDLVVEISRYVHIKRDKNLSVIDDSDINDMDETTDDAIYTCQRCQKELRM